jgi:hypothetical protein
MKHVYYPESGFFEVKSAGKQQLFFTIYLPSGPDMKKKDEQI